jgi:uncharacterized protein (DUF1697 family)
MKPIVYRIVFRSVGGKTQLPTKPLRESLTDAGFENAATYINSGNAVVRCGLKRDKVIETIAALCREHFSFDKAIFAPTLYEWDDLIARNPFSKVSAMAPTSVHASLLAVTPRPEHIQRIRSHAVGGEELEVIGNVAYLHTSHGFGRSKMAACFDKGIGVINTARNWNTVLKLAELGRVADT